MDLNIKGIAAQVSEIDKAEKSAEQLMNVAREAAEKILPGGVKMFAADDGLSIEFNAGAMAGGIVLFGEVMDKDAVGEFIKASIELTCQALIVEAKKQEE